MKAETDPITDDEWLLRRVRVEKFRSNKTPIISPNAFEPRIEGRDPDTNGISLFREACLNDPLDILATVPIENRDSNSIVRIPVSLLHELGLTVEISLDSRVVGHVVIPEMNSVAYSGNQGSFTATKLALAEKASENGNIVRKPADLAS